VTRARDRHEIAVSDELSPLREAMVSVDGKAWRPVEAADGLVDSRSERLQLDVPADATVVLLRLRDAAFNVTTFDLTPRLKDAAASTGRSAARAGSRGTPQ
jgi:hypothetical protein